MCRNRISAIAIALAATTACVIVPSARADMKVVQTIAIDSPQMKQMMASMPASQRAAISKSSGGMMFDGTPVTTTVSSSGKKYRTDLGEMVAIIDAGSKQMTVLNPTNHTYRTSPYDPSTGKMQGATSSVHDTGQTKMIMGHKSKHYTVTLSMPSMGNMTMKGDIWAAQDLPQPPSIGQAAGPMGMLQEQLRAIKGMPLITTMSMNGGMTGSMTIKAVVKSVSMAKLPASLFRVPSGYKAAPAGGMAGMMGR